MENYLIIIEEAENNYSAYSPDVDGCIATGDTPEEARKNYLEALEMHIEGLKEDGLEIPKAISKVAFCAEDCSGVLNVRVKKSLHYELIKLAEQEGISVSHLVNDALIEKYSKPKIEAINSYIVDDSIPAEKVRAIGSGRIATKMNSRLRSKSTPLTERELAILELIAKGESIHKIATKLSLTDKDIKNYTLNLLLKLSSFKGINKSTCLASQT